jgi:hypothetical protein
MLDLAVITARLARNRVGDQFRRPAPRRGALR